jgi:hypothetical protein
LSHRLPLVRLQPRLLSFFLCPYHCFSWWIPLLQWWCRQQVPPKRSQLPIILHGIISQKINLQKCLNFATFLILTESLFGFRCSLPTLSGWKRSCS